MVKLPVGDKVLHIARNEVVAVGHRDRKPTAAIVSPLAFALFQRQANQSVSIICHEQRDVQNIIVQLQVVKREPHAEFDLIAEQLFEFFETLAGGVGLGLDLHGEDVVLPLDEEIHLIGRVALAPVSWYNFKLCDQSLKQKILS